MKLCIAYMMYISSLPLIEIDNYLTNFRSILTFCYFYAKFFLLSVFLRGCVTCASYVKMLE